MPYKLKPESVDAIVKDVAMKILSETFKNTDKVDGEKLIALTNSRQVNSFLIRSLFNQWSKEVERLESPYFDFKHEKVKEALKDFMNVLSNHISIDQEHLESILFTAIKDTILISFAPDLYLDEVLERADRPVELKSQLKYIKTNRAVFKAVCENIDEFDTKPSLKLAFEEVDDALFESIDEVGFVDKLGISHLLDELFTFEEEVVVVAPEPDPQPEPSPVINTPSTQENAGHTTLNDQFQGGAKGLTLAEKLQQGMKKSIESDLTLNEKFMFQNSLFGGDVGKMREALKTLDSATDLNDALNKANAFNQGWDMESEEIEAFMGVLERRFS